MTESFLDFGKVIPGCIPDNLTIPAAKETWHSLVRNRAFTVIDARELSFGDQYSEILVVDCENDSVPTKNTVGIEYRERLGLLFHSKPDLIPEVRALRTGFPATLHQNHVLQSEPSSLCLYFEPWHAIRPTWTPQKHLNRILWWLAETASGTLHRSDQPLEQLYFQSPYELILPFDFYEKIGDKNYKLIVEGRAPRKENKVTLVGQMRPINDAVRDNLEFPCIGLSLLPILHGPIERFPYTLGELHDQVERRGAPFSRQIFDAIFGLTQNGYFIKPKSDFTLLILSVPLLRKHGATSERTVVKAFIVEANIANLGVAIGALEKIDNQYLLANLIGVERQERQDWRQFRIDPLEVLPAFTPQLARQTCGIESEGPKGTLAGVGALGSEIFNLWARSGWGQWTLIDPDHIKPHNLARHTALECHVGFQKVDAVKSLSDYLMPEQPSKITAIGKSASNFENAEIKNALETSCLIIDATTTLDFPRKLAGSDSVKRALSVFLTPSGLGAVMLVEDENRAIRLDALEAQYYRQVISQSWGEQHLSGHSGHLWTGAGCRDVSAVIPNEQIALHGANISYMTRLKTASHEAAIQVWHYNSADGSLATNTYHPAATLVCSGGEIQIVWDELTREKIRDLRQNHLPKETGGVLLGYFDLTLKKVFIVDALSAPPDSHEEPTGFVRGIVGLESAVEQASRRTANIVGYVGEWHSHPYNHTANPSGDDILLLAHLANSLDEEGLPALMLIVGEHEERWIVGKAVCEQ